MHDPMVVAYEIKSPFKVGKNYPYRRSLVTVWHVEPEGRDAGTVCGYPPHKKSIYLWLMRHREHLQINVEPYLRVKRWIVCRCAGCGFRFAWKEARFGYMGGEQVWHGGCMNAHQYRSQLNEAYTYIVEPRALDSTATWRVEYFSKQWFESELLKAATAEHPGGAS